MTLLYDGFDADPGDLNGRYAESGQFWAAAALDFFVDTSGVIEGVGGVSGRRFAYTPAFVSDITYTAQITLSATSNTTDIGLVVRRDAAPHRLYIRVRKISGSNRVDLITSPGDTVLASNTSAGLVDGASIELVVVCNGPVITVSIDSVQMFTHTLTGGNETTYTGSDVGITLHSVNDGGSSIHELTVEPLGSLMNYDAKVIAHRARHGADPENSFLSMQNLGYQVDGVEIDVRWTSDDVPVLMHDATVDRTTSGTGLVSSFDLAGIQALTVDNGGGQSVPTLETFLSYCGNRYLKVILVDINATDISSSATRVQNAIDVVQASPVAPICIFMVRGATQISEFRDLDDQVRLGAFDNDSTNIDDVVALDTTEVLFVEQDNYLAERTIVPTILGADMAAGASAVNDGPNIFAALSDACSYILTDYSMLFTQMVNRTITTAILSDEFDKIEVRGSMFVWDGNYQIPVTPEFP